MANAIRPAKSDSDWSDNELIAYITISPLPPGEFFPTRDPTLDHIDSVILNSFPDDANPAVVYLSYLDLAVRAPQESIIGNFAAETLKLLGFNGRRNTVLMHYIIPLTICGEADRVAQTDVCLVHSPTFVLLLLVEYKTLLTNKVNAEAQVIAEAVAALQFNNKKRADHGLDSLDTMTIPCVVMTGTRPIFYLVPVTGELSNAVIAGQYPATQTRVLRCVTTAEHTATQIWCATTGMEDTEYRKLALKRFPSFKALAKSHWVSILEGF